MNQIVADKMKREVMVVHNDKIFWDIPKVSKFYPYDEVAFEKNILENFEYMVRAHAEINFSYKQPIGYGMVVNEQNEIFVYMRWGADSNAGDKRLHNKIAIGVWGHIEREDEDCKNPIKDSLIREIEEEINILPENILSINEIGYINSEDDEVSQVHIGVIYALKVHNTNIALLDGELDNGEFVSFDELEKMMNSDEYAMESWSKICFPYVKDFFLKK